MTTQKQHREWVEHPTGKIPKGTYCDCCGRFNARTLACNAVLVNQRNEVLLVLRGEEPDKDWWDIPGGYLDWDETLEECAIRELQEETGLHSTVKDLKHFYLFSDPDNKAQNQVVDVYFYTKTFSGEISVDGTEIVSAKWFSLQQLPQKVAFDHRNALEHLTNEILRLSE